MAVIVARPSWSKQVKDTIDYLKKKKYEKGDRLAKVGQLKELLGILGISMQGWNQWFRTSAMEEFSEKRLSKLCNDLRKPVLDFLEVDHEYTKEMEDKKKKECKEHQKHAQPAQPLNDFYVA